MERDIYVDDFSRWRDDMEMFSTLQAVCEGVHQWIFVRCHMAFIIMTSLNGNIFHYWPFVRGIHRSLVNSPHKGQWRGALMFSLICVWINGWVNNGEAGDLRRYLIHYGITVMIEPMGHNELNITYYSLTDGFNSKWAGDINLCFIYCSPEQVLKQTVKLPVIWDAMMLMWHLYNDLERWNHRVDWMHLHCVCRSRFCGWHGYHSGSFKYRLPWWYRLYSISAFSALKFGQLDISCLHGHHGWWCLGPLCLHISGHGIGCVSPMGHCLHWREV